LERQEGFQIKHSKDALVTGGAGFIGSHLVDRLMQKGHNVTVLDNLSNGSLKNLESWINHPNFTFTKADLKDPENTEKTVKACSTIFHFAANPEVRIGETEPQIHFEENLVTTFNLLEALRKKKSVKTLVFASTSTVYGRAAMLPTPENYAPLVPISTYGASKLGCEALVSSYAHTFEFRALILRLANIIGPRSNHGVVVDFIKKLKDRPDSLEILGDGNQNKSYMYIDDCIDATIHLTNVFTEGKERIEIFNVGTADQITVKRIANIVIEEMTLSKVKKALKGEVEHGGGWIGDVENMCLSIEKLIQTGWKPKHTSEQAVRLATRCLLTLEPN
jgi:UDP-glucose 4-epimerase